MTAAAPVCVGRGRPRLWLLGWILAVGSVVAFALVGRWGAPPRSAPSEPALLAVPAATSTARPSASELETGPTALPSPRGEPVVGQLRLVAPSRQRPVSGDGMLLVVATGDTGSAERVVAQVFDDRRLVTRATVPVAREGVVRGWVRLEPRGAARALRLRLTHEGESAALAEMPFVQLGERAVVLTAPWLPDQPVDGDRVVVIGRVAVPVPEVVIRLESDAGPVASRVAPVRADSTRIPVEFVFWNTVPLPASLEAGRLWLTVSAVGADRALPATRVSLLHGVPDGTHLIDGGAGGGRTIVPVRRLR